MATIPGVICNLMVGGLSWDLSIHVPTYLYLGSKHFNYTIDLDTA